MMSRIYISADIEGTCGIAHWDETEIGKPGYDAFRQHGVEMTYPHLNIHVRDDARA